MLNPYWRSLYETSQSVTVKEQGQVPVKLNHNLNESAYVASNKAAWHPSPAKGVKRLMLERDGGEKAQRATSIVAYEPDSHFSAHSHPLGEEFLVLSGTFSDEHGDYPAGTYVRNPPGSSHTPFSRDGCMIWVKLQQFSPDDSQHVVIRIAESDLDIATDEIVSKTLFSDYEQVQVQKAQQESILNLNANHGGVEILLLNGEVLANQLDLETGAWLRVPAGEELSLQAKQNASWLIKTGHLR